MNYLSNVSIRMLMPWLQQISEEVINSEDGGEH